VLVLVIESGRKGFGIDHEQEHEHDYEGKMAKSVSVAKMPGAA
jgi:hypothetical protein